MRLATQEQAAAEAAAEAKAEAEAALEMARLQAEDKESVLLDIVVLYSDDGYVDPPPGYWKVPYDLNKVLQTRLLFSLYRILFVLGGPGRSSFSPSSCSQASDSAT